eukprot:Trichotokara_eunicae@DN5972_c0_g2_i1.p1
MFLQHFIASAVTLKRPALRGVYTTTVKRLWKGDLALNDTEYVKAANLKLMDIYEKVNGKIKGQVDMSDGVLSVTTADDDEKEILINRHYVTRQLWYSSPISGADYFDYPKWVSERSEVTIEEKILDELKQLGELE